MSVVLSSSAPAFASDGGPRGQKGVHSRRRRLLLEARADFCNAICAEGTYLINESISSLERRLVSEGFIRVHRSYLVNLEDVHNVEIGSTGLMELRLDRVTSTVPVSRRRAAEVKAHLGLA